MFKSFGHLLDVFLILQWHFSNASASYSNSRFDFIRLLQYSLNILIFPSLDTFSYLLVIVFLFFLRFKIALQSFQHLVEYFTLFIHCHNSMSVLFPTLQSTTGAFLIEPFPLRTAISANFSLLFSVIFLLFE